MIRFSDGHFYIGCSKNLKTRITTHVAAIKSGLSSRSTCKTLRKMEGFSGSVELVLLEVIDSSAYVNHYGPGEEIVKRELHYLRLYADDPMLLNDIRAEMLVRE